MAITVSLVAAVARNGVMGGHEGGLPWHLPRDIAHFRNYTAHHHNLVGRRTYEEMIGWYKTQIPVVMTHDERYRVEGGYTVQSVSDAIHITQSAGDHELVVLGGAEVFKLAFPYATKLVMTYIDADIDGAVYFPDPTPYGPWIEVERTRHETDSHHAYAMDFVTLVREAE